MTAIRDKKRISKKMFLCMYRNRTNDDVKKLLRECYPHIKD